MQCYMHAEREAAGICTACGKPICQDCSVDIQDSYHCKACAGRRFAAIKEKGEFAQSGAVQTTNELILNLNQIIGILGAALLISGVFAPAISVPFYGTINFFRSGRYDGTIILVLGIVGVILALLKTYRPLWLVGAASLFVLLVDFVDIQKALSPREDSLNTAFQLDWNVLLQFEWGWLALIMGSIFLITASVIKSKVS